MVVRLRNSLSQCDTPEAMTKALIEAKDVPAMQLLYEYIVKVALSTFEDLIDPATEQLHRKLALKMVGEDAALRELLEEKIGEASRVVAERTSRIEVVEGNISILAATSATTEALLVELKTSLESLAVNSKTAAEITETIRQVYEL